jgi:hypothetical protein
MRATNKTIVDVAAFKRHSHLTNVSKSSNSSQTLQSLLFFICALCAASFVINGTGVCQRESLVEDKVRI